MLCFTVTVTSGALWSAWIIKAAVVVVSVLQRELDSSVSHPDTCPEEIPWVCFETKG